jgi:stringent starvation protein B
MRECRSVMVVAGLVGLLAVGCSKETTSSRNIKTGGIAALTDVYADTDTTATVHVELRVGGSSSNTYINLEDGDQLIATAGDQTKTLSMTDEAGVFEAKFSGVGEDTLFSLVLERPHDTTASENSGTLPAPFTLEKPTDDLSRKNDELEVTWAPSGTADAMTFAFDGDCIFNHKESPSDSGSFTLSKGELDSTGGDKPEACKLDLETQRSRSGTADPAFDSESWFRLHQRRSTSFVSAP